MAASLGATTYSAVTWTAGDVITEAKLDAMVANDQAYDSHSAQGILLNNEKALAGKNASGTAYDLLKLNSANEAVGGLYHSGWNLVDEAWTYASATTINVPSGATGRFQKGDKIRLKQGAGYKYYYVVGVASTVLTVNGGVNYTVANSAITDIYFSREDEAMGFPKRFTYTPTWIGSGGDPAIVNGTLTGRFSIAGGECHFVIYIVCGSSTTYGTGNYSYGLPITASSAMVGRGFAHVFSSHAGVGYVSQGAILPGGTTLSTMASTGVSSTYGVFGATTPFTWANGDILIIKGSYEI